MASESIVFLTGAPPADSVERDRYVSCDLNIRTRRYLNPDLQSCTKHEEATDNSCTAASVPRARWRHVSLSHGTKLLDAAPNTPEHARFFSVAGDGAAPDLRLVEDEHETFLEHSLSVLQDLASSQIQIADGTFHDDEPPACSSFQTSVDSLSINTSLEDSSPQIVCFNGPIMDLKHIPNASHLQSIHPQTMTINILATVISIQPARTIQLRKRTGQLDIVEVLVGDETRAGFSISFWLPTDNRPPLHSGAVGKVGNSSNRNQPHPLREVLTVQLQGGDILLLTYVALSVFGPNVYGQSLSEHFTRNKNITTKLTVLSPHVAGLSTPSAAKLQRVREWTRSFVGKRHAHATMGRSLKDENDRRTTISVSSNTTMDTNATNSMNTTTAQDLPPDTQPGE